jgi:hypothetical protein
MERMSFLAEYSKAKEGLVICRTQTPFKLAPKVTAVSWQDIPTLVERVA